MRPATQKFREAVRDDKVRTGLTWKAYSKWIGLSWTTLNKIVHGDRMPAPSTLEAFEKNVPAVADLLDAVRAEYFQSQQNSSEGLKSKHPWETHQAPGLDNKMSYELAQREIAILDMLAKTSLTRQALLKRTGLNRTTLMRTLEGLREAGVIQCKKLHDGLHVWQLRPIK